MAMNLRFVPVSLEWVYEGFSVITMSGEDRTLELKRRHGHLPSRFQPIDPRKATQNLGIKLTL